MKVISFIQDYTVIDKIINYLKLRFITERPPPALTQAQLLMAAEDRVEYFKEPEIARFIIEKGKSISL